VSLSLRADEKGILPDRLIAMLVKTGAVILPARSMMIRSSRRAFDLRLGEIAYRVRQASPVRSHRGSASTNEAARDSLGGRRGAGTGCVYIVPLMESLSLPPDIAASANPKSSDRPARRLHPVIADPHPKDSTALMPATMVRFTPEISPRTSRCWCAKGRVCRSSGFAGPRGADGETLSALHRRGASSIAKPPTFRWRSGRRRSRPASAPTISRLPASAIRRHRIVDRRRQLRHREFWAHPARHDRQPDS